MNEGNRMRMLIACAMCLSASGAWAQNASVPVVLQGDWLQPSKPSATYGSAAEPAVVHRFGATNYIARTQLGSGVRGMLDADGWNLPNVKDADGSVYSEEAFTLAVRTNTAPWQLDLRRVNKSGDVEQKGICEIGTEGALRMAIGNKNMPRPASFEPGDGRYVVSASRIKTAQKAASDKTQMK